MPKNPKNVVINGTPYQPMPVPTKGKKGKKVVKGKKVKKALPSGFGQYKSITGPHQYNLRGGRWVGDRDKLNLGEK
jgi:hypothetical protein